MSRYEAVLWDLDGTIADTVPLIRESLRHAIATVLGYTPDDETLERNIFMTLEAQMRIYDPARVDELCAAYLEWNHAVSHERLRAHPGMVEMVRDLQSADVPQGLASSKSRAGVALALDILELEDVFEAVVTSNDVTSHKPDPAPLRLALELMDRTADGACYVGDTISDAAAAQAAGLDAVGVSWGFIDAARLREAGATAVAETPGELRDILGLTR